MKAAHRTRIRETWVELVRTHGSRPRSTQALERWATALLEATEQVLRGRSDAMEEAALNMLRSEGPGPSADRIELLLLFRRVTLQVLEDLEPHERDALADAFDRALLRIAAWHDGLRPQPEPIPVTSSTSGEVEAPSLAGVLAAEVARSLRYGRPLSLMLLRVDSYEDIATLRGLETAERVMDQFLELLDRTLRAADVRHRIGPDRIAVLLPETGPEDASIAAERVRKRAAFPESYAGTSDGLVVTVGIASCPAHATDPNALVRCAEDALELASRMGGDLVLVYPIEPT